MKKKKYMVFLIISFLILIPLRYSEAQTNYFYYQGKKILMNLKNTEVTVIFSDNVTKTDAEKIISQSNLEGELHHLTNVGLKSFYLLKFNEQKSIKATIDELKNKENVIWANPVFERKGTFFKVYNRFVAKLPESVTVKQIEKLNEEHKVKLVRKSGTGLYTFELSENSDMPVMDMSNLYYKELNAEWAMPDFIVPFEFYGNPSDQYFSYQWNFSQSSDCDIDAPEAWDISTGISNIIVAVFDTGIKAHPDLPNSRLVTGYDCVPNLNDGTTPYKNAAHGMACAGLIAASHNSIGIAGLAPNSKIMPIQAVGSDNKFTSLNNLAAGFDYASTHGADIISNSWGGEQDVNDPAFVILRTSIENALTNGRNGKGCVVLFASGNDGANYVKNTMATIDGVIAVGATDINDYKTSYSNYGTDLDLTAPSATDGLEQVGVEFCSYPGSNKYTKFLSKGNIWTIDIPQVGGYNESGYFCPESFNLYIQDELDDTGNYTAHFGGTSAACPQAAGVAALILAINPNLSYNQSEKLHQVEYILRQSADKVHSNTYNYYWNSQKPGHSKETGYGRINAFNALKYTLENYGGTLNNGLTIHSNETWNFEPGVTVTFKNNSKLIVNGTLNVNGTSSDKVTFDFIAPNSSNGIWFYQGSNGTIDNAKIKNAYYGVRMYKSHPTVQNTEIFDCKYGIYFDNLKSVSAIPNVLNNKIHDNYYYGLYFYYSDGKIRGNKIYNNNYGGVIAYSHSSPQFGHDNYLGNNDIHHNGYGFKAYYSSSPDFGRSGCTNQGGNNKIENNTYKNGYAYNSNVFAQNNWWGSTNENTITSKLYANSGYTIYYDPWLWYIPFGKIAASSTSSPEEKSFDVEFGINSSNLKEQTTNDSKKYDYDPNWPIFWKMLYVRNLIVVEDYKFARDICKEVIDENPDSLLSFMALDYLWQATQVDDKNDFINYLNKKTSSKEKKNLYGDMELILANYETTKSSKVNSFDVTANKYAGTFIGELSLFNKFMYYLNEEDDEKTARLISDDLDKKYPNSESTLEAHRLLGDDVKETDKELKPQNTLNKTANLLPKEYALLGNYPNPFNPSTTIKYALPFNSNVELTIYDMNGKEVRKFVINTQSKGYGNVVWDGTNNNGIQVSSGVYVYKFKAISLEGNGKVFEKSAKLMLLK